MLGCLKIKNSKKGFIYKKKFGQNFLTDSKICEKIVNSANLQDENVVEIGPGYGILTKELLKKAKKVVAIEKDKDLVPILEEKFSKCENLNFIFDDFLKLDLKQVLDEIGFLGPVSFCANLPFYITSPIIIKILQSKLNINTIVLMVQKEMAVRLAAKPGDRNCGAISVFVHYYCEPKILFNVLRGSFFPVPKVDASVIKLEMKKEKSNKAKDEEKFFLFVRAAFSKRRKMFINAVAKFIDMPKNKIAKILKELGVDKSKRAEDLTLFEFVKIYNFLKEKNY